MKTLTLSCLMACLALFYQSTPSGGILTGTVMEKSTNEPVIFGTVFLLQNGATLTRTETDYAGNFTFANLSAGTYTLLVSYVGFSPLEVDSIEILDDSTTHVECFLESGSLLSEVQISGYKVPLIEQDNTSTGRITTAEQIRNLPTKDVNALASKTTGTTTDGSAVSIRGTRSQAADYYVDGIRVSGNAQGKPSDSKARSSVDAPILEFNREGYDVIVDNAFLRVENEPLSTFSIDVDRAAYSNVRRFLQLSQKPPADAVRIEEMINYFDYDYPEPEDAPFSITAEMHPCPWNADHQLLHLGLQGEHLQTKDMPPSNLVFLIDGSGSMNQSNKLPLVKQSLKLLVEQLREEDRIALVVYAGNAGLVLPSVTGKEKEKINEAIDRLAAGGSTAGAAGIQLAYQTARAHFIENGNNRVILATDGDFNVGLSSDGELVRLIEQERDHDIFLTVLGFGMGNYQDAKMQQLADKGNGNHAYIDGLMEAKKVLVNEFSGTLFTIAKDVKIQIEFNPAYVASYRLIGYENRVLANEDFNDDKKDAGEIGAGHTVTALYEIVPAGTADSLSSSVDPLRYQKTETAAVGEGEWMWVKFRYKEPKGKESKLIQMALTKEISSGTSSDNFRWSASVAAFGMLLRDSEHKGNSSIALVRELAEGAVGKDKDGLREEFLSLLNYAEIVAVGK